MAQTYNLTLTEEEVNFIQSSLATAISFNKTAINWSSSPLANKAADNLRIVSSINTKVQKLSNIINDDAN